MRNIELNMNNFIINKLCIIGVGLIGGSLARALKKTGTVREIIGTDLCAENLIKAKDLGIIDRYDINIKRAVIDCDIIVLAVPLGAMKTVLMEIEGKISDKTVITDVGSAKRSVVNDAKSVFGDLPAGFVPAHPITGAEKSGAEASFAELYENRRIIITPLETSSKYAVNMVRNMWKACGAEVVETSTEYHDEVLAATSHLPHMLAYSLVDTLACMDGKREIFDFAAGGFRDFTRIASSNPIMWHDICLANQDALVKILRRFSNNLNLLSNAIKDNNSSYIKGTFIRAKKARDEFYESKN